MAERYWIGGGTSTAWNATPTTNWSATSGGTTRVAAPTGSDNIYFDGVGTNANGTSALTGNQACLNFIISAGFTGTLNQTGGTGLNSSGSIITLGANCTLNLAGTLTSSVAATLTFNGKFWTTIVMGGASTTKTLADDVRCNSLSISVTTIVINGNNLYFSSVITSQIFTGTTLLIQQGVGNWSGSGGIGNNLTITGTLTLTSASAFQTRTLTVEGTLNLAAQTLTLTSCTFTCITGSITEATSTVATVTSVTFNLNGQSLNILAPTGTNTINSLLVCATINISATPVVFAGTTGWITDAFNCTHTGAATISFKEAVEYIVTTSFLANQSRTASIVTFTSSHATTRTIITLLHGATCNTNARFTRIDAGIARSINTWNAIVTNCINVNSFTDYPVVALSF